MGASVRSTQKPLTPLQHPQEGSPREFHARTQVSGARLAAHIARVETQAGAWKPTARRSFGAAPRRVCWELR
jgi:Tfp pilus assembly protein PilP